MLRLANIKTIHHKIAIFGAVFSLVLSLLPSPAYAGQITARSLTIDSSVASDSTTYSFTFTVPSATVLQSASFTPCTTASGACTTPAGWTGASADLTGQPTNLGDASGWTDASTATALRLAKTGNSAAPSSPVTVSFDTVTNPSAANSTFYVRIATFSDDAYTTGVDTGVVASSTAGEVTVNATVDETLTFTLTDDTVNLGTLGTAVTGADTSTFSAATNATSGYDVYVHGTTLTSGSDTIDPMTSSNTSTQDSEEFGLNVRDNATPDFGSNPSGGSGTGATGYNTADNFQFNDGDKVAQSTTSSNTTAFTVTYIANIAGATEAGAYQTVLNYTIVANF